MALIAFTSDKALANDIYVHQIGDDLDLDVVQDGEDNSFTFCATTVTTDATCATGWNKGNHSDNSTVAVSMTGDDNEIYMSHAAGCKSDKLDTNSAECFIRTCYMPHATCHMPHVASLTS